MARNGHFIQNMIGKTVSFDVQPYRHGKGTIAAIKAREVTVTRFQAPNGQTTMTYDVFDVTIDCEEGRSVGALWGGVPVQGTVRTMAGTQTQIVGVSYFDLYDAAEKGKIIVQVCCG